MRKKGLTVFILLALLLSGCGEKTQSRAEEWQQRYAQMQGYEALVEVSVPREDETLHYTLSLEKSGDSVRAAVIEPEELTGIAATLTGDALTLEYDGMALDAGTLSPRVSALNCVPLVLDGFSRAYLDSVGSETLDGKDTLRADFSMTLGDETLGGPSGLRTAAHRCIWRRVRTEKLLPRRSLRILFLVIYYLQVHRIRLL